MGQKRIGNEDDVHISQSHDENEDGCKEIWWDFHGCTSGEWERGRE